jgi:hypothetical protein
VCLGIGSVYPIPKDLEVLFRAQLLRLNLLIPVLQNIHAPTPERAKILNAKMYLEVTRPVSDAATPTRQKPIALTTWTLT